MFKLKSIFFYSLLVAGFLASGGVAHAQVTTSYDFGTLLQSYPTAPGYVAPNYFALDPFAHLEATSNGDTWTFTLNVNANLLTSFGPSAHVRSINFDFTPTPSPMPVSTFVDSNVGGVTSLFSYSGDGPSGLAQIDFGTRLGLWAPDRLQSNDWVTWDISGLGASSLTNMYVKVYGVDGGSWAKYVPIGTVVPEPETYAMMLVGLGLLGFTARRRRNNV